MEYKAKSIIILLAVSLFSFNCSKADNKCDYNRVTDFEQGRVYEFPDFKLEFLGERTEKKEIPGGSISMRFQDFSITGKSGKSKLSWSSGTGDIAPQVFEVDGVKYELELAHSDYFGRNLAKNELVIVKK